jgi:PAS domain-containing protein
LVRDISAARGGAALREEERLRSITENAPDFIAEQDLGNRFIYVNRPDHRVPREEMIGLSLSISSPKDIMQNELCSRPPTQAANCRPPNSDEPPGWNRMAGSGTVLPGGRHVEVGHVVLISTDITVQKLIEEQLREAEEFTRATLNSLSEHIAILDEDGLILWVNQAWENYSRDNRGDPAKTGVGVNYLEVCDLAAGQDAEVGKKFAEGIRAALREMSNLMNWNILPSAEVVRWFIGRVQRFSNGRFQASGDCPR